MLPIFPIMCSLFHFYLLILGPQVESGEGFSAEHVFLFVFLDPSLLLHITFQRHGSGFKDEEMSVFLSLDECYHRIICPLLGLEGIWPT